jgi:hypothetical protein
MSLEAAIKELTEAVKANTAAVSGGAATGTKPAGTKPAAGAKKPAAKKPAAKKGPTADTIAEAFGEYLKTGDKEERDTAKTHVKAIIAHFDVGRITELDESNYQEALDLLAQYKEGEDPFGEEEEEDGDLM